MRYNLALLLKLFAWIALGSTASAQTQWTKYPCNAVLDPGGPEDWDSPNVHGHAVIFDDGVYKMWYSGGDWAGMPGGEPHYAIGYATSHDGITWAKHEENPVFDVNPRPDRWDSANVFIGAAVLIDNRPGEELARFKMWYDGDKGQTVRVGFASSPDGIHNWTRWPEPVIDVGEKSGLRESSVVLLEDKSEFYMWFVNSGDLKPGLWIELATSQNGIDWDKRGPVLMPREMAWDFPFVGTPMVFVDRGVYRMFYCGGDYIQSVLRIGQATSTDGVNWEDRQRVLSEGSPGSWDALGLGPHHPFVHYDARENLYKMWYYGADGAVPPEGVARIGYATSLPDDRPSPRRAVSPPPGGCPLPPSLNVSIRQSLADRDPEELVTVREVLCGPFGKGAVRAEGASQLTDRLDLPVAPLGIFSDHRTVGTCSSCDIPESIATLNGATYTLRNIGNDIGSGGDAFTFVYSGLRGDFTLTARVSSRSLPAGFRTGKHGIMIRQDLSSRSRYAFVHDRQSNIARRDSSRWSTRPTHGGADDQESVPTSPGEHYDWFRIERSGTRVAGFVGVEKGGGEPDFFEVGVAEWNDLPETFLVGLAVTSETTERRRGPAEIRFDGVSIDLAPESETVPVGPGPSGVEISWELNRSALAEGVEYSVDVSPGQVRFSGVVGGEPVAGQTEFSAPPCAELFRRGDANADGGVNLSDPVALLGHLFMGSSEPTCLDAADADDDENLSLTDAVYTLNYLFQGGAPPPAPGIDACGADPEGDALDCREYGGCGDFGR